MVNSSVQHLETVDYSKRIFKVKLLLEEGDLRAHASLVEGSLNAEYKLIFFVGLANFQPVTGMTPDTYTSMLQTTSSQPARSGRKPRHPFLLKRFLDLLLGGLGGSFSASLC